MYTSQTAAGVQHPSLQATMPSKPIASDTDGMTAKDPENPDFWNRKARDYDRGNDEDDFLAGIMPLLDIHNGERVLDMGCGTGEIACMLARAGHQVIAADFSQGMLEKLREKLNAAPSASRVTPLLMSWDDSWPEHGVTNNSVDVSLAIRSLAPEHPARYLEKLDRAARRRAVVLLNTGHSPRVMPELLQALGLPCPSHCDDTPVISALYALGRMPVRRLYIQRRWRTFASRDEALTWGCEMAALSDTGDSTPRAASLNERLNSWLDEHLKPSSKAISGTSLLQLDIPQTNAWAVISWDTSVSGQKGTPCASSFADSPEMFI